MRAIISIAANYPETLRPALKELAQQKNIEGLDFEDIADMIESAEDFAITEVELID
jgi:hypothetical protein